MDLVRAYEVELLSLKQIAKASGRPISTVRSYLIKNGVKMRGLRESVLLRRDVLGSGNRGKKLVFSEAHCAAIGRNAKMRRSKDAVGLSWKLNGYVVITMGPDAGRNQHVVLMEQMLGRKLLKGECVHHIDGNKHNNKLDNLELMTLSEHTRLHRLKK